MPRLDLAAHVMSHTLTLSIAGLAAGVVCDDAALIDRLRERYRAFLTDDDPQLTARVHLTGQLRASALLDTGTVFRNGILHFTAPGYQGSVDVDAGHAELTLSSAYPVEDVDYFLRVIYALLAFRAGGLLFHAAGVVRKGRAYLFFGHSGSGKTTVARLSSNEVVLNDDLLLLMPGDDGWQAYATPFWNPSQVRPPGPRDAPAAMLLRLVQDTEVFLEDMRPGQAIAELISNVPVIPSDPARNLRLMDVCRCLLRAVPVRRLHFLPDDSFWRVVETQEAT